MPISDVWIISLIILAAVIIPLGIVAVTTTGPSILEFVFLNGIIPLVLLLFSGGVLILGVIIAYSNPKIGKNMAYIGIAGVLLSLIFIEVGVATITTLRNSGVRPSGNLIENIIEAAEKNSNFKYCKNIPVLIPVGEGKNIQSMSDSLACIISGYTPQGSSSFYILGFWIFGVVIPLLLTSGIFLDLVESSGVVKNRMSQRLIGWSLGFLAYRGFIVTGLIFILDFAAAGMAVIALNFIFIGGLLSYTNRIFSQWKPLEDAITVGNSATIATTQIKGILKQVIHGLRNKTLTVDGAKNMLQSSLHLFDQAQSPGLKQKVTAAFVRNNQDEFANDLEKILKQMK
ncbi:MAG: hypothetical protein QXF12_05975 [Candidatus Aenigmatarchaeota archaeon]